MAIEIRTEKNLQLTADANYRIRAVFSPAPAPPGINLNTNVSEITIQPQATGQLTATVTSQNNFSGQVNLYFLDVKNSSGNSVTSLFTSTISPLTAAIGPSTAGQFNVSLTPNQVSPGTYTLTLEARTVGGTATPVKKDITIIIPTADVRRLIVSPASSSINVQQTVQLNAFIQGVDLQPTTNVTWTVDNTSIATISSTGLVTGVTGGTVTVTATSVQYGSATARVDVIAPPSEIKCFCYNVFANPFTGPLTKSVTYTPCNQESSRTQTLFNGINYICAKEKTVVANSAGIDIVFTGTDCKNNPDVCVPTIEPTPTPSTTPIPEGPSPTPTPTPSKTPPLSLGCKCYTTTAISGTTEFAEYVNCGESTVTRTNLVLNTPLNICARIDTVTVSNTQNVSVVTNNTDCTLNPNICQPIPPSPTPSPSTTPAPTTTPAPSTTPGITVTPSPSVTPAPSRTPSPSVTPAASQLPLIPPSPTPSPVPPPPSAIPPSPSATPVPSRTPAPSPPPIITWRNCTDGLVKQGTAPAGYREVPFSGAGGGTCWEPAGTVGFAPALNEVLTFVYQRGSSEYPQPKTVVATNPSYGITYRITLQSNPNVLILPNSFIIPPRRDVNFIVNVTPTLLQELGDGTSTLRMSVTVEEL